MSYILIDNNKRLKTGCEYVIGIPANEIIYKEKLSILLSMTNVKIQSTLKELSKRGNKWSYIIIKQELVDDLIRPPMFITKVVFNREI